MQRDTQIVRGTVPGVERATVRPYENASPGQFHYQRYAHPVGVEAERLLSELDGGQALLFPSGMAATTSVMLGLLAPGSSVAIAYGGYFGTIGMLRQELVRWGLEVTTFDQTGPPPKADLVWLEPCANPFLTFPDLDASIAQAHANGSKVIVDNTVLSPLLLRPHEHGADFVLHSATKILAGHHDALLGVVSCADPQAATQLGEFRKVTGIVAAPDPAWLLLRGLKTLGLRVERQSASALELARRLAEHPAVATVRYPGLGDPVAAKYVSAFGPLLSFDVADEQRVTALEVALKLIENATSLGGVASTLEGRYRWEPDRVPPGLVRMSVGLEDVEDLWADLSQALDA